MAFEELRSKTDKFSIKNKRPSVFMLTIGNIALRRARSQFASSFFVCAGFEIIDNPGFKSMEDGTKACIKSKAEITVICSSDDEYADLVPQFYKRFKDKSIFVVAGYPKTIVDELKQIGVQHFIHIKSNVLETLREFQEMLGIKEVNES